MGHRKVISNFHHSEGDHCESTTLRDHFNFLDFPYSEALVFGLDATMGFAYFPQDSEMNDFIIGGKQKGFDENSLACRLSGILIEKRTFQRPEDAWVDAKKQLDNNNPLILQLDMGYLPFFKEEVGEDFHFGGHILSLVGYEIDDTTGEEFGLLADNNFNQPQKISITDLHLARNSKKGSKYMWPHNVRYTLKKRPDGKRPPFGPAVKMAIQAVVKNFLASSTNYSGIGALKKFGASIENWKSKFEETPEKASEFFKTLYGYIEEYGTGGSLFRKLYYEFLKEILKNDQVRVEQRPWTVADFKILEDNLPLLHDSCELWSNFAKSLNDAYLSYTKENKLENPIFGLNLVKAEEDINQIITKEEIFFNNLIKLKP